MTENIIRMQELTYELEALLNLAATNTDRQPSLLPLIANKIAALEALLPDEVAPFPAFSEESEIVGTRYIASAPHISADQSDQSESALSHSSQDSHNSHSSRASRPLGAPTPTPTPALSVNDRFFYARELFGGNLRDLDQALADIATLPSYDAAEDYLYSDWALDPESAATTDFLLLISRSFS